MADGKWITGLTPEMPADEAARVVLSVRLSAVRHHLPLAVERASEDVEHVHQLRVATRRAGAAVWFFRDLLPKKSQREAKRVLRAVRRAAGGARDWDVFLTRLGPSAGAAADFLAGYALRERLTAQDTLAAVAAEQTAAVHDGCAAVPAAVRSPASRTLSEHATVVLGTLVAQFAAEQEANPTTAEGLHQLRITAKRLRYAMEISAGCFPSSLREVLYPAVEEAQELLGGVQDAAVTVTRLEQIEGELRYLPDVTADRLRRGVAALADDARGKAATGEQKFRQWLERWRRVTTEHPFPVLMTVAPPAD
jgi:CHAD domain-containing protein